MKELVLIIVMNVLSIFVLSVNQIIHFQWVNARYHAHLIVSVRIIDVSNVLLGTFGMDLNARNAIQVALAVLINGDAQSVLIAII